MTSAPPSHTALVRRARRIERELAVLYPDVHTELNFTTPLESANTPNLDAIARRSKMGTVTTVGKGIAPESDIAVFNMLGYSFASGYPGRGVVESIDERTACLLLFRQWGEWWCRWSWACR